MSCVCPSARNQACSACIAKAIGAYTDTPVDYDYRAGPASCYTVDDESCYVEVIHQAASAPSRAAAYGCSPGTSAIVLVGRASSNTGITATLGSATVVTASAASS